ncbi:MAG: hypothetical protein K8S20_10495 [Chloroflexi bacterium]|nr:hypothetical protein [Chloroflexota bacterium]
MNQIASILALLVGIMSIVAGGKAMRGWNPGYSVLTWLPVYNFVMGILALIPAVLIWMNHRYAMITSITTLGIHAIVLLILFTAFRDKVAYQSLAAMVFRLATWVAVIALMYFQALKGI